MIRRASWLTLALSLASGMMARPGAGQTFTHPCMYLDASEIKAIRERIGNDPECRAMFTAMASDAEELLTRTPQPVEGPFVRALEKPLTAEGDPGPPTHAVLARKDFQAARDLGIVYALSEDERCAAKVVEIATAWAERMTPEWPKTQYAWQALAETLPTLLYGVDLCWNSTSATTEFKDKFKAWVNGLGEGAAKIHPYATAYLTAWNLNCIGAAGVICEKPEWVKFLYDPSSGNKDTFQALLTGSQDVTTGDKLPGLFMPTGQSAFEKGDPDEVKRAMHVLKALYYVAELARHQGQDFYAFESKGRGLRKPLLYYAPQFDGSVKNARNRSEFRLVQDVSLYELGWTRYQAPEFARVIARNGRPVMDPDLLGPVGLTHGTPLPVAAGQP